MNNSESSSGLEWQNLGSYCCSSSYLDDPRSGSLSKNWEAGSANFGSKDAMDGFGKVGSAFPFRIQNMNGAIISSSSVCSVEPMTGLRLGSQNELFPDSTNISDSSVVVSSTAAKRSRFSPSAQNSCCQVEGCNLDLTSSKDYHRRHRICENHSKSPKVVVGGMERRFCQQCSRFHDLLEFDDKKRSCRRRLSNHNARRRRLQPESSSPFSSAKLYDRRAQNALSNRFPVSVTNSSRENICSSMFKFARDSAFRPSNASETDTVSPNFSNDKIPHSIYNLQMDSERFSSFHSLNSRVLDRCLHVPPVTNSSTAPLHESAQSLLSSNSWSLNEAECTSMDGLVPEINYNPIWANFQPAEQVPQVHSASLHYSGSSQFQLFKAPYDSGRL